VRPVVTGPVSVGAGFFFSTGFGFVPTRTMRGSLR
jgi:hypothetical protein